MGPETESVCPVCLQKLPARRVEEGGSVYLEKTCPEHGPFRTLIWEGEPSYWAWAQERKPTRRLTADGTRLGCPYDCGLCGQHRQRTCCVLLEVTHRCNLCCPVCFASAQDSSSDPGLDTIAGWYDILRRKAPGANIQLSGGEPTVRDDLPQIIALGREKGFTYFQLNTNGLRLAREPDYAQELKDAGLSCVFLQFDGVTDEAYRALRGAPLLEEKKRAIDHCAQARLGVVLVPVLAPGVNVNQVGDLIRFAQARLPVVRGVHFQPMSYFGRYPNDPGARLTLPRLLREIEGQTGGLFRADDFSGGTAEHAHCSFSCNYLLQPDGTVQALKPQGGCCCCGSGEDGEKSTDYTAVEHARDTVARRWGGAVPEKEAPPDDPDSLDGALYQLKHKRFSISAMAFQDAWNLDLERLRNCYIHIMSPEGRLVPFCAYNLTSAGGKPLYRHT